MSDCFARMNDAMALAHFAKPTREAYAGALRGLARFAGPPETLDDEALQRYFLYLVQERKLSQSTVTQQLSGLKFFYERVVGRSFTLKGFVRAKKPKKLPVVLSRREVRLVLAKVWRPAQRTGLTTIYSCGLRLSELLALTVSDIDSERMQLWVRNGKGLRDRGVPLSESTLELLRAYWRDHRRRSRSPLIFESHKSPGKPYHPTALQRAFSSALRKTGIRKRATVHTLRHSYATHLLEGGVHLRVIQMLLGHRSSKTTARYLHVTKDAMITAREAIDELLDA